MPTNKPTDKFISFDDFIKGTAGSKLEDFASRGAAVSDKAEFEKMRQHISSLYEGIKVTHSFIEKGGAYVDCVPIDKQPGLRAAGGKLLKHPGTVKVDLKEPAGEKRTEEKSPEKGKHTPKETPEKLTLVETPLRKGEKDHFGNELYCPPDTIPMRRLTLEQMSRFKNLEHYFQRGRFAKGHPGQRQAKGKQRDVVKDASAGHRYAHASQSVSNQGGSTFLEIWDPNPSPGVFSLSQIWVSALNSANQVQTVECGWQVFPEFYGSSAPSLFTYWTADDYQTTGNYNLDAPAFVQTNNEWVLGGAVSPVSTSQDQTNIAVLYNRDSSGNWWLGICNNNDTVTYTMVGYYPSSLWGGNNLASMAQRVDFGGEVCPGPASAATGQMGSGQFASQGNGQAAWQVRTAYIQQPYQQGVDITVYHTTLQPFESDPNYYTINLFGSAKLGTAFFFGGPGGP